MLRMLLPACIHVQLHEQCLLDLIGCNVVLGLDLVDDVWVDHDLRDGDDPRSHSGECDIACHWGYRGKSTSVPTGAWGVPPYPYVP